MSWAETISEARKKMGMSQTAFAKLLGTSQNRISCWENGKQLPTKRSADRVHKILKSEAAKRAETEKHLKKKRKNAGPHPKGMRRYTEQEIANIRKKLWGKPPGREAADGTVLTNCPKNCYFRGNTNTCDYILLMEVPRPCQIGKKCTEYVPAKGQRRRDMMLTIVPEKGRKGIMR